MDPFDFVIASSLLHEVQDPTRFLRAVRSVCGPETVIHLNVPNDKGGVDTWGMEGMSPNFLGRRGWTKNTFKPGDKATIVVRPVKDGSPGGMFVRATTASGQKLTGGGAEPNAQ